MVNWIWIFLITGGFLFAAAVGRIDEASQALFDGAKTGVTISLGMIGVLAFWMGMMRIAEEGGLVRAAARALGPVVRFLFPDVPRNHPALGYILSNLTANVFGLGNAATPMGIRAMQELQKLNPDPTRASAAMCTLLAVNTASVTLLPTTIIAVRANMGATNPADVVGTTLLATAISTAAAIVLDRWYRRRHFGRPPAGGPNRPDGKTPSDGAEQKDVRCLGPREGNDRV